LRDEGKFEDAMAFKAQIANDGGRASAVLQAPVD
jgi:hypothetical protein